MLHNQLLIFSPLEQFEITNLLSFNAPFFGYFTFTLTNLSLYSIMIFILIICLHIMGNNDKKLLPSKWSIALESLFSSINTMVRDQIGSTNEIFLPFIYSLFCFILLSNLIGNIPYSFVITSSAIICLGLSFTIFMGVTILSLATHKIKFFSFFIPQGCPLVLVPMLVIIEFISYFSRSISLGVRLFANICAGHSLVKILTTFLYQFFTNSILVFILALIPFTLFILIIALEIGVSIIQSFVFCLLTCTYIRDAIDLH
jgi:F-type H+-transporting ATPase subunit a